MTRISRNGPEANTPEDSRGSRAWLLAALLLAIVFEAANFELVNGRAAPIWDAESFFAPAFTLIADHARAGRLVLWNPWQNGGSPDYAEPELGAFSPFAVLVGVITGGTESGFRAYWLLLWFLGPLGILLLARHLGAPPWAGFIVALGFAFSGFYTGNAEHTSSLYSISFLPWFLWRLDLALTSNRARPAAEAGALWGFSALGGYPQLTILSAGFLLLWALGRWCCASSGEPTPLETAFDHGLSPRFPFRLLALAPVLFVGVLVLAPSYVAFFSEVGAGYSDRVGVRSRDESVGSNAMEAGAFATLASPYLGTLKFYNPALWPTSEPSMSSIYLGAPITILALLAVVNRPRSLWRWWLVGVAAFFLACAVGNHLPVRGWLYDYCPPTRYFRNPGLFRVYAMFCALLLALLAAKDLQAAIKDSTARIWKRFVFTGVFAAIGAAVSYAYVISKVETLGDLFYDSNGHLVCVWLGSIAVASLLLSLARTRRLLPVFLGILAVLDAFLTIRLAQPTMYSTGYAREVWTRINANHSSSLDLAWNALNRESFPAAWIGGHENNENVPMKAPTFFNYATMKNRFHKDFAQHAVLEDMSTGSDRIWFSAEAATLPPTDTFYAALVRRSEALGAPVLVVHPPTEMSKIKERGLATPRDIEGVNAISRLPAAKRVLTLVIRYTADSLDLDVSCPQDGWLLVTDRWSRGWRARVNGQPAQVFGGDFIFRAVRVRAGENIVQFSYRPDGWPILLILSWGTLAITFVGPLIFHTLADVPADFGLGPVFHEKLSNEKLSSNLKRLLGRVLHLTIAGLCIAVLFFGARHLVAIRALHPVQARFTPDRVRPGVDSYVIEIPEFSGATIDVAVAYEGSYRKEVSGFCRLDERGRATIPVPAGQKLGVIRMKAVRRSEEDLWLTAQGRIEVAR